MQLNPVAALKQRYRISLHQYVSDTAAARPTIIPGIDSPLQELVRFATGLQTIRNLEPIKQGRFTEFVLSIRHQFQQHQTPSPELKPDQPDQQTATKGFNPSI